MAHEVPFFEYPRHYLSKKKILISKFLTRLRLGELLSFNRKSLSLNMILLDTSVLRRALVSEMQLMDWKSRSVH